VVIILVPLDGLASADVEAVVAEGDAECLYPREGTVVGGVVVADEVGVDVEIGVRDEAEVLVPPTVEVEGDAVAACEARVTTRCSREYYTPWIEVVSESIEITN
jgi:hypothetical protein